MRQLKITKSITSRESESLDKYLREIGKIELLSTEEEINLVALIKKGDKTATDKLIKANLRFVVSVAKQYQGQGLSLSDLINEGNVGLIKSVKHYDETRGFKFISFAVWWIRQSIIQGLAKHARLIRLPLHKVALKSRIQKTSSMMEQELERLPSDEELAEALNMDAEDVASGMSGNDHHVSLDTAFSEDEDATLIDTLENANADVVDRELCHTESLQFEINRSLDMLNKRQREALCYFFGIGVDHPMSLDEIAERFEVTTERVRQIKDNAINKLRSVANFSVLQGFLRA
ncbi:MAG: RNA polymerase sigma factor RpoD/SigA [Chitinophagales bacterium]